MITTHPDTGINDRDGGTAISYIPLGGVTPGGAENGLLQDKHFSSYSTIMHDETQEELEEYYSPIFITGEDERTDITPRKKIVEILKSAIHLVNEVLEVIDDEIERINTFSLLKERIRSMWELREDANNNFVEVLVLLEVAVKNSQYQNYQKKQYKSIKVVLEKIKEVYITSQKVKECRKILMDNGIDLFAPIRNWENYTIEIKTNDARK